MSALGYNERSWAVDVISAINSYASVHQLEIRRAGGEHTLKQKGENSLFPDVILFGDAGGTRVRHGWEMKFPDTAVDDTETIENAARKANRLGVNSFVIWNVDTAHLHVKNENDEFEITKVWGPLGIKKRLDVPDHDTAWRELLSEILEDLNGFFEDGSLKSATPAFLSDYFFADFLNEFSGLTAQSLEDASNNSAQMEAQINIWWASNPDSLEKGKTKPVDFGVLAQAVIVGWINRLLFCHYLKSFRTEARAVDTIQGDISLDEGIEVLSGISEKCNFMQIFQPSVGTSSISNETWFGLKQLNAFMTEFSTQGIPQQALRIALEKALSAAKRKIRGQFTTPDSLARLVIAVGMDDRKGHVLDPCCGTGTIPKAALLEKTEKGQDHRTALSTIWASDRFQFPLQFATIALAEPEAMGTPIQAFLADVFSLELGMPIELTNPDDGSAVHLELPKMALVASNLPFVRFETLTRHDPNLEERFSTTVKGNKLDSRADLFAYIILFLKSLLKENGRICVIVSNAWLGTEWGEKLRETLEEKFYIDTIITSGAGRWFDNADVVTNILCLKNKDEKAKALPSHTRFVTTLKKIEDWDAQYISELSTEVHANSASSKKVGKFNIINYPSKDLSEIEPHMIGWPGFFANVSWIKSLSDSLVPVESLLKIARGERRGWDELFYPVQHNIEPEYIRTVLLNARNVKGLNAIADGEAFCCSRSVDDLTKLGHVGALAWIDKFSKLSNGTGKPLPEVLKRSNLNWFEMSDSTRADFAIGMNPEDRIFTMRLNKRSFVNQRLIRLTAKNTSVDFELLHALLNSSLAIFFIETSGFGRGLGALDTQPTKLKKGMKIPDLSKISKQDRAKILAAFQPLLDRDVKHLDHEMTSADRINLDDAVLSAIGKQQFSSDIREALLALYFIRKSVKN